MNAPMFAALDFETTGLGDSDRVLEIGVVLLDSHGAIEQTWETLVDPDREFNNSNEHHIARKDVQDAPYFDYIARNLAELLRGRILVAHDLERVNTWLVREFARLGVQLDQDVGGVSTLALSKQYLAIASEDLVACLRASGAPAWPAAGALGKAVGSAALLAAMLPAAHEELMAATPVQFTDAQLDSLDDSGIDLVPRPEPAQPSETQTRQRAETLRRYETIDDPSVAAERAAYLKELVSALSLGALTARQQAEMLQSAARHNLSVADVRALHEILFARMVVRDGHHPDMPQLAEQLGVVPPAESNGIAESLQLRSGDHVCFLGPLALTRETWQRLAKRAGLTIGGIDQRTVVVITNAPHNSAGLLDAAEELEIPIVTERTFAALLDPLLPADAAREHPTSGDAGPTPDIAQLFPWCSPEVDTVPEVAKCWIAEYPETPLAEMSPYVDDAVLPDGLDPNSTSVQTWLRRFPKPLAASVAGLAELPGFGPVRIEGVVQAAVWSVIDAAVLAGVGQLDDAAIQPGATMDLAAGWLDLLGHWPDLEQVYVAQLAVPERLGHQLAAATKPGDRLIAQAVAEIGALLRTDAKRRAAIIAGRATGAEHLQELGDRFGITRERIRQLEAALLKELRADAPACETVVSACAAAFSPCASLDTAFDLIPGLAARIKPDTGRNLLEILTWVYGQPGVEFAQGRVVQWRISDGWLLFDNFESVVEECAKGAVDHNGVLQEQQLVTAVLEHFPGGSPERISDYCTEQLGYIRRGPFLLPPKSSILDRVAVELALHGSPMTTDQLHALISDRSRGSIVNVLGRSEIFVRSAMDTWALKEWGLQEWTNLSDFLLQRIEENGGEVPLEQLKEEAKRFGISKHSVGFYVSGPEYILEDGIVRVNTETPVNDRTPEDSKGMYFHDDAWMLLVTVTDDHLRGSGSAVPLGVAALYGLEFNEPFEVPSRLGPQTLRWGRVNCSLSTIRRFLEPMDAKAGDRVWFVFADEFDVLPALPAQDGLRGLAALLNAMAIEADTEDEAFAAINLALGLPADAPRRQAVRRLRNRNDDELAELLRQA